MQAPSTHAATGVASASPASPVRRAHADDVDHHAANLSGWQQRYDQLSGGAFHGDVADLWFDEVQVFRERTSHAVRQTCRIRDDTVWCGLTLADDGSRIEGRRVGAAGVMVCGSSAAFELLTPDHHDIFGIVATRGTLVALAEALGQPLDLSLLDGPTWLDCPADSRAQLQRGLALLLGEAGGGASCHDHAGARRFAQQAVLASLVDALAAPQSPRRDALSFARRQQLVRRACALVDAQPHSPPTVPELCAQLHTSRRSLQYAFETVVGASPVAHLRSLRLNAAHRALRAGSAASVQDAAAAHGFWSLSQFAADYRRQFAERPSQTLARGRGDGAPPEAIRAG
jgi:AraC family transcriptional regulator, ethanolamine operon transcriptional activator